jgi:hypothetical protein
MIEAPDKMAPGAKADIAITLNNTGELDWPAATKILVAAGGTSELVDPSWRSNKEVGTIGLDVPAGQMGVVQFAIRAPMVSEETPLFTQFELSNAGMAFGTINIGVTVTPNGDEGTSSEGDDLHDDGAEVTGGCNAGGNASWLALLPLIGLLRRRRK